MTDEAVKTIKAMSDLAERSLPPELYELWVCIASHYDNRIAAGDDADG